jgi:peptide/nickel transport system substrate-binding protein
MLMAWSQSVIGSARLCCCSAYCSQIFLIDFSPDSHIGQYVEMSRYEGYWDKHRIPKLAKMVLIPMPEATTRLAALRSGQVDWIEVPPPDAIPSLKSAGFQISLWPFPHVWPYILNTTESSVFHDKRLRQALNDAIDRDAIAKFLNGTAKPAYGVYPPDNPDFGKPEQHYGL